MFALLALFFTGAHFALLPANMCRRYTILSMFVDNVPTGVEVVLLLRTYAFTGAKKIVLVSLSVCLAGIGTYQVWAALRAIVRMCNSLPHPIDLSWFNLHSDAFLYSALQWLLFRKPYFRE